jgi:hypothetical protein
MLEMTEAAAILHGATEQSLVLMDEIGRGTSTFDGLALAGAIASHLHDRNRAFTLFATHYFELTEFPRKHDRASTCTSARWRTATTSSFLHEIQPGPASRSYGVQVARLAGMPSSLVRQARATLEALETQQRAADAQIDLFAAALPAARARAHAAGAGHGGGEPRYAVAEGGAGRAVPAQVNQRRQVMTYCVGIKLNAGLVFLSDSRTSAGLDQISTFRKMMIYERPGDRFMVLLSAGNLSISQSVREILQVEKLEQGTGVPAHHWNRPPACRRRCALLGQRGAARVVRPGRRGAQGLGVASSNPRSSSAARSATKPMRLFPRVFGSRQTSSRPRARTVLLPEWRSRKVRQAGCSTA